MPSFASRLQRRLAAHGPLCVGIDPSSSLLKSCGLPDTAEGALAFGRRVLEAADYKLSIVKPQSAFFERFARTVGVPPMEYLQGWRMSIARDLLRRRAGKIEEIASQVGYGSASAFSTAFTRHVGLPPKRFAMTA